MKNVIFTFAYALIFSNSSFASEVTLRGYLKESRGSCEVKFEKQNEYLYNLYFKTRSMNIRANNIDLSKKSFDRLEEYFDKNNKDYDQVFFYAPIDPSMFKISIENLGHGIYQLKKTRVVLGVEGMTSTYTCKTLTSSKNK